MDNIETTDLTRENARVKDLLATGEQYRKWGGMDLAARAVREGKDVRWLSDELLRAMQNSPSPASPVGDGMTSSFLGLTARETGRYSVLRAINALADGNWSKAPFEKECHDAIENRLGRSTRAHSVYVPHEVQRRPASYDGKRDLSAGTGSVGGYLVATDNLAGSFIDALRNAMLIARLGATILPGLKGNVTIPKMTAAGTAYWLSTEATAITESTQTLGQLALTPKSVGAYTEISRLLMLQSSPAADSLVMNDLAKVVGLAVDLAAINGSGASGQPLGVLNTSGIGSVTGTSLGIAGIVEFQSDVAGANGLSPSCAYLTTPAVAALLAQRQRFTSTDTPLWAGNLSEGSVAGYRAASTNQMPSATMIFGDFSQIVIGEWGTLEIALNPYANFPAGIVGIRAFQTMDVGVRIAGAFSVATSIT